MRFAVLAWLLPFSAHAGALTTHSRLDDWSMHFQVAADLTYTETFSQDWTLLTDRGVSQNSRAAVTFHPRSQTLQLLEAWVVQPDGTRLTVPAEAVFTRPSEAAQDAPGFTASETTTVVFPQLHPGSRTHVAWRLAQKTAPINGFNIWVQAPLEVPATHIGVTVESPAALELHTALRGPFRHAVTIANGVRTQTASIENTAAQDPEPNAVDAADFQPLFLLTSLPNAATMGAIYARAAADRARPTPDITALAARIAGQRTGLAAARAVYDWVAANIRYVAVYMNPNDGWVPHDAAAVLKAGYGDCKDHVVLTQALLAARGIAAEAALVNYGEAFATLPLWMPTQYNHAIVYLPEWHRFINPTDPFASFDAADRRLAGKQVVLAIPGGAVARIPPRRPEDNVYRLENTLDLAADGTIAGRATLALSASIDSASRRMMANALSAQDLAERLLEETPEGGFGSMTSSNPRDLDTPFVMQAAWTSPHAVALHGGVGFAALPAGIDIEQPAALRSLLSPKHAPTHNFTAGAFDFTWHVVLRLPAGIAVTRLPADVDVANAAGRYVAMYRRAEGRVEVTRHLTVAKDVFAPGEYEAFDALIEAPLSDAREVLGFAPDRLVEAAASASP
jgi:transglutaminase-like putative cysteine protease